MSYPLSRCLTKCRKLNVSFSGLISLNPTSPSPSVSKSRQTLMDGNLTYLDFISSTEIATFVADTYMTSAKFWDLGTPCHCHNHITKLIKATPLPHQERTSYMYPPLPSLHFRKDTMTSLANTVEKIAYASHLDALESSMLLLNSELTFIVAAEQHPV